MPDLSGAGSILSDSSVADLAKLWGDRTPAMRTFGDAAKSHSLIVLQALSDPLAATFNDPTSTPRQREDLKLPYLNDLAEHMAKAWASHAGWETQMLIKAVGAAKAQTTYIQAPQPNGGAQ